MNNNIIVTISARDFMYKKVESCHFDSFEATVKEHFDFNETEFALNQVNPNELNDLVGVAHDFYSEIFSAPTIGSLRTSSLL